MRDTERLVLTVVSTALLLVVGSTRPAAQGHVTQAPNDVVALDAKTGRVFWVYEYAPSRDARP